MPIIENERVLSAKELVAFAACTLLNLAAVAYAAWQWSTHGSTSASFVIVTLVVVYALLLWESKWLSLPTMTRPLPIPPADGLRVAAVTTFVPTAESRLMLAHTLRALVAMDYPHDTWVLDEGDDPDVAALCSSLGVKRFTRAGRAEYLTSSGPFKRGSRYGNYNAWLDAGGFDQYDVLAAFDPDHIPRRRYLVELLGYLRDPRVGHVQSPQGYYNQSASFVARAAAEETYAYFSSVLMSSYTHGHTPVLGGHSVHRLRALREVGGFARHEADDLVLALNYRAAGWRGVYVPKLLARGTTPVDWRGYLLQQQRWARSVIDMKLRVVPRLIRRLRWRERAGALMHGTSFLLPLALPLILGVLVAALIIGAPPISAAAAWKPALALAAALVVCDAFRQRFNLVREERRLHWRPFVVTFAKWPHLLQALWQGFRGGDREFSITPKGDSRGSGGFLVAPHVTTAACVGGAWVAAVVVHHDLDPLLHICTFAAVTLSLGLVVSTLVRRRPPFDESLAAAAVSEALAGREPGSPNETPAAIWSRPLVETSHRRHGRDA